MGRYGRRMPLCKKRLTATLWKPGRWRQRLSSLLPPVREWRAKRHLRLPWRGIREEPSPWHKIWENASPIELGQILFVNNISCLYPVYIRGEASLAAGRGTAATAEFQKILDHSGIVWNCWTGALAHLGVARANALQSRSSQGGDADRGRALAAYKDFLTLWKDADPDIPILKEAKAEYAKLP